jgi:hypothetical protein
MLLSDLRTVFENHSPATRLPSSMICADLADMEERPWPEFRNRKPITPRLSKLLAPFGIVPNPIRDEKKVFKGYHLESLQNALARYVPPDPSVTRLQPAENSHFLENLSVTNKSDVTDRNHEKPQKSGACNRVTDKNRGGDVLRILNALSEGEGDREEREAIMAIDGAEL